MNTDLKELSIEVNKHPIQDIVDAYGVCEFARRVDEYRYQNRYLKDRIEPAVYISQKTRRRYFKVYLTDENFKKFRDNQQKVMINDIQTQTTISKEIYYGRGRELKEDKHEKNTEAFYFIKRNLEVEDRENRRLRKEIERFLENNEDALVVPEEQEEQEDEANGSEEQVPEQEKEFTTKYLEGSKTIDDVDYYEITLSDTDYDK